MKKAILLSASLMLLSTAVFAEMTGMNGVNSAMPSETPVAFTALLPSSANVVVEGTVVTVTEGGVAATLDFSSCSVKNSQGAYVLEYSEAVAGAGADAKPATVACATEAAESDSVSK